MSERTGSIWDTILAVVIVGVVVYALALVFFGLTLGDLVFERLNFGPSAGEIASDVGLAYLQMVYAILGAVIVGWMITLWFIARGPLLAREAWSLWAVVGGVAVWFVLDTGMSLVLGFYGHAAFNVAFAVALAIPLWFIGREALR